MLMFPAPSPAICTLGMVEFSKAWRKEATLIVGDLEVLPSLKTCVSYWRALQIGIPALPMVLSIDIDGETNYYARLSDGQTDRRKTIEALDRVGL